MARIRTIKPEWLDDEKLARSSDAARVLSIALITLADCYGRGGASELMLGSRVFPESPGKIRESLEELRGWYVRIYEVRGSRYFEIINWSKHQKIHKPGKPLVPEPGSPQNSPGDSAEIGGTPAADLVPSTGTVDQDRDRDLARARVATPIPTDGESNRGDLARARDLWLRQEEIRTRLRLTGIASGGRALTLTPTKYNLEKCGLLDAVQNHSDIDLHHVLDVRESEAKMKKTLVYLNGITNWKPEQIARSLSTTPEEAGKSPVTGANPGPHRAKLN